MEGKEFLFRETRDCALGCDAEPVRMKYYPMAEQPIMTAIIPVEAEERIEETFASGTPKLAIHSTSL